MNESTVGKAYGERIATLESVMPAILEKLHHLDDCVDGVKDDVKGVKIDNIERDKKWDRRWNIAIGAMGTMFFLSSSGTVSLKSLIELLSKLHG